MKKLLLSLFILFFCTYAYAQKITALTEDTSPTSDDLLMTVDTPSVTPTNKKIALSNLYSATKTLTNTTIGDDLNVAGAVNISGSSEIAFSNGITLDGSVASKLNITGGNVGINQASPLYKLDIKGSLGGANPQMVAGLGITNTDASSGVTGGVIWLIEDDGAAMGSGHRLGALNFTGAVDAASTLANSGAGIFAITTEAWTSTATGTRLSFETATNGAAFRTPKMSLGNDGFLGVGTSSPTALVDSSSATGGDIQVSRADTTVTAADVIGAYKFKGNDTSMTTQLLFGKIEMTSTSTVSTDAAAGDMTFYTTGTTVGGSPVQALQITSAQNTIAAGTVTSTRTTDIGWSIVTGANTACNTTCTSACVHGWETTSGEVAVACSDATADKCLCAGAS